MSKDKFLKLNNLAEISESERLQITEILTKRCSQKTKNRMYGLVMYDLETLYQNISWFDRVYIRDGKAHYNAGQSYPCEIRAIRNEILRKYP